MDKFILSDPTNQRLLPDELQPFTDYVTGLEQETGSDILLSASPLPHLSKFIRVHANKGIPTQIKHVSDLVSSFQDNDGRLWRQLIRLKMCCEYPVLLIIGKLEPRTGMDDNGKSTKFAVYDGRESRVPYLTVVGAIEAWQRHGGYVTWLSSDEELLGWCQLQLRHLEKNEKQGGWNKTFIARQVIKPLELLSRIETTLLTIPNIGPEKAQAITAKAREFFPNPTLLECMRIIRDNKIEGIGEKIRSQALDYIGFDKIKL